MVVSCLGNNELSQQVNQVIDTTAMTDGQLSALCKILAQLAELNINQDEVGHMYVRLSPAMFGVQEQGHNCDSDLHKARYVH